MSNKTMVQNLILHTDVLEYRDRRLAIFKRVNTKQPSKLEMMLTAAEQQQEAPATPQKSSKLAMMLATAKKQQETEPEALKLPVGVIPKQQVYRLQQSKQVNAKLKTRRVSMFTSQSLRLCFLSTDVAYYQNDYDDAIHHAKQHLETRKKLAPLLTATDLTLSVENSSYRIGKSLDKAKARVYDKFKNEGWEMLCNRPRVK